MRLNLFPQRFNPPELLRVKRDDAEAPLSFKACHVDLELKAEDDATPGTLSGYGSLFDVVDSYNEVVKKGAFKESLRDWKKRKRPIPMLWQHFSNEPIGAWTAFEEDEKGLKLSGQLIMEIPQAVQALACIKAQVVTGLSIGFFEIDADPWWDPARIESGEPRRLKKLDLRETSVVTFPALREAQLDAIKARVARGLAPSLTEFEKLIQRELGVSRSQAAEIAEGGYKAWALRVSGPVEKRQDLDSLEESIDHGLQLLSKPLFS